MSISNMTLLSALVEMAQHAEGRRVELKHLRTAVGRLCKTVVALLREGDTVTVNERVYTVVVIQIGKRREKALAVNGGILGDVRSEVSGTHIASLEDTTVFAAHAAKVIITFFMMLENQRRELSNAERRMGELLTDWWGANALASLQEGSK